MAVHRYWRLDALESYTGGAVELSEVRLLDGATPVDGSAVLTGSLAPLSGSLASLADGLYSAVVLLDQRTVLRWDLGSAVEVNNLRLGGGDTVQKFLLLARLSWSDDGSSWTPFDSYAGLLWPGARAVTADVVIEPKLLLRGEGADGATTTVDSSSGGLAVVLAGGAKVSTAQAAFGGSSLYFPGTTGAYLAVADDPSLRLGDGDYTIDFRMFNLSVGGGYYTPFFLGSYPGQRIEFRFGDGGFSNYLQLNGQDGTGFGGLLSSGFSKTALAGAWHAVRLCRAGGVLYLYIDGTRVGTMTFASTLTSGAFRLGCLPDGGQAWNGYIDDLGIIPGLALSTGTSYTVGSGVSGTFMRRIKGGQFARAVGRGVVIGTAASAPTGLTRQARVSKARPDYASGVLGKGVGRIVGTVKEHATGDVPVYRRVRLHRQADGLLVREAWSDKTTGAFDFQYVDEAQRYYLCTFDQNNSFRAVIADNLAPTLMP